VSMNRLHGLPDQLSSLGNLKELLLNGNDLTTVPVSILKGLTALKTLDMSYQFNPNAEASSFEVSSPLLPILHPGLVKVDLRQRVKWGPISLFHLGCALGVVANRRPIPTVLL
jgi:hypothetical protein